MRIRWKKNSFTLMFIPGANSKVRRAKLPHMVLYITPAVIVLALLTLSIWLYGEKLDYTHVIKVLTNQLRIEKEHSKKISASKDQTIETLQNEIIQLTEKAEEVRKKLEELKRLEDEVRKISDISDSDSQEVSILQDSGFPINPLAAAGIGGVNESVTDDDMQLLISQTESSYSMLTNDIDLLSESLTEIKVVLEQIEHLQQITPSIWPTKSKRITSGFGVRRDPFTRKPAFHSGVDFSGKIKDPVFATAHGTVEYTGKDRTHGNRIIINHTNGIRTVYMHLHKILVKPGDPVEKGQKIGLVGSTGRSTGPHLHYEVHKNRRQINPMTYIP